MKVIIALLSVVGSASAFTPLRSHSSLRARAVTRMSEELAAEEPAAKEPVAETAPEEPAAPSGEGR